MRHHPRFGNGVRRCLLDAARRWRVAWAPSGESHAAMAWRWTYVSGDGATPMDEPKTATQNTGHGVAAAADADARSASLGACERAARPSRTLI